MLKFAEQTKLKSRYARAPRLLGAPFDALASMSPAKYEPARLTYGALRHLATESNMNNNWLSKAEIALHFGIGLRTVTDWMQRRILPFIKVGGVVRFYLPDCEKAVRNYQVKSRE